MERHKVFLTADELDVYTHEFLDTIPKLLGAYPEMNELVSEIHDQDIRGLLRSPFQVAIIGQTNMGKSTLMNVLLDKPMALTSELSLTSTINRYSFDNTGELHKIFRIHKRGSRYEDRSLDYQAEFVKLIEFHPKDREDIVCLEFFADSDILKGIFLIDTPGTRSVKEEHEKTVWGFLAEDETLEYTNRADAIIYTVQHNLREDDNDFLKFFGDQTKLQTAFPNNSIAVVQLWDREENIWGEELEKQCDALRQLLKENVSVVLPTSPMLAIAAAPERICADTWQQLAELGASSDEESP